MRPINDEFKVSISDIVAPIFLPTFNSYALYQIDKGGRNSFKSSKNEVKIAKTMLEDPECEVVIYRKNYKDHKVSTFPGLKIGFRRLGWELQHKINYPAGDNLYIKLEQGNYVHFRGGQDYESEKGVRPHKPGNQTKILWLFEVTQFKDENVINNIISSYVRGEDKDYFMIIIEYNPHPKKSHWTYAWIEKMAKRKDVIIQHTNYCDHPKELFMRWAGVLSYREIMAMKELDPEQFKSIYLGLPANLLGGCYKEFDKDVHGSYDIIQELRDIVYQGRQMYYQVAIGCDFGERDATVYTATGFHYNLDGIDEFATWYHKNGVTQGLKNINHYNEDFFEFALYVYNLVNMPILVRADPANLSERTLIAQGIEARGWEDWLIMDTINKLDSDELDDIPPIMERINVKNLMINLENYYRIDKRCIQLHSAHEDAEFKEEDIRLDDGSTDIDSLDSDEYSWLPEKTSIRDRVIYLKSLNIRDY